MPDAEIGVFGGSGFSELLPGAAEVVVETPYGPPSAPITVGEIGGRRVAFLPRHGRGPEIPPHMINYRANIAAREQLGNRSPDAVWHEPSRHPTSPTASRFSRPQYVDRTS